MMTDEEFMLGLQRRLLDRVRTTNCGPFLAAVVDRRGTVIAEEANGVVEKNCSHWHAEMTAIKSAEERLGTYDLGPLDLVLYTTAEPCMMCAGGILWSGIRKVVFGVSTAKVESIAGFDEGVKEGWREGFEQRGIEIVGPVEEAFGEEVFREYLKLNGRVYNPSRGCAR